MEFAGRDDRLLYLPFRLGLQLLVSDTIHELINGGLLILRHLAVKLRIASDYTYTIQLVQRLIC